MRKNRRYTLAVGMEVHRNKVKKKKTEVFEWKIFWRQGALNKGRARSAREIGKRKRLKGETKTGGGGRGAQRGGLSRGRQQKQGCGGTKGAAIDPKFGPEMGSTALAHGGGC